MTPAKPKATTNSLENGNLKLLPAVAYFAAHDVLSEAFLSLALSFSLLLALSRPACCLFQLLKCLKKLGVKTKFVHKAIHFKKAAIRKITKQKLKKSCSTIWRQHRRTHTHAHAHRQSCTHAHTVTHGQGSVINLISAEPETYLPDINTTQPFMPTQIRQ